MIFFEKYTTISQNPSSLLVQLRKIGAWLLFFGLFAFSACVPPEEGKNDNDKLVAKVFNKSLFQSELQELIGAETAPEDSIQIAKAYIEKWVRDAVLMHEAEKYVPKDLNIDDLVRDYRASLIRHNYEKLLVKTQLDSLINQTELEQYYEKNREQYKLKNPALQCHFIKMAKDTKGWDEAKSWWKEEEDDSFKKLLDFCSRNAEVYLLDENIWYNLSDISSYLPKGKLTSSNYQSKKDIKIDDDEYDYLLNTFNSVPTGEYAPLEFVKDQATKVILHQRKTRLLEDVKEDMYDKESQSNNVKIFVN